MSCKLNGLFEKGTFVQSEFEATRTDGLKQLLEIAEMRFIALQPSEDVVDVGIGGWNRCKMCGNDTLEYCRGDFEALG